MAASPSSPSLDLPFSVRDRRRKGFFTIDNDLLDRYGAQLGPYGLAVYMALARFVDQESLCWPSLATIAKKTGMSRRQVIREIDQLQALGLIAVQPQHDPTTGEHKANLYLLLDVTGSDSQSPGSDSQSLGGSDSQSPGSDSQSPKQYPKNKTQHRNKTHRTTSSAKITNNNNNGGQPSPTPTVVVAFSSPVHPETLENLPYQTDPEPPIALHTSSTTETPIPLDPPSPLAANQAAVQALLAIGLGPKVAQRLASRYSSERIAEKLAYLAFLQAERPDTVQNPRGWLRRAIEEDYGPPDGFITKEERARREVEAAEAAQRGEAIEQQHQAFAAQAQERQEDRRRLLQERYGTTEADDALWAEVLAHFKHSRPDLHDLYARAQILRCTKEVVQLGFEQEGLRRQLEHPGILKALQRQLKLIAKRPLGVETVLLPVAEMGYTGENGAGSSAACVDWALRTCASP